MLGKCREVLEFFESTKPRSKPVNTGGVGTQTHHETGTRGVAERRLAVGVVEKGASGRQFVDVGGFGVGVSAHATDPVVLVIDRDEENVGLLGGENGG